MRKTMGMLALIILAACAVASAGEKVETRGWPPSDGDRRGPGMQFGFDMRRWEKVELTSSQKKRLLDAMTRNFRASQEVILEQMESRRKQGGSTNDKPPGRAGSGKPPGGEKLEELRRQLQNEIETILTPEQLRQLGDGSRGNSPPARGEGGKPPAR